MARTSARVYSASELDKAAGISAAERRALIDFSVIVPARTGAGHAIFQAIDIETAKAWKQQKKNAR